MSFNCTIVVFNAYILYLPAKKYSLDRFLEPLVGWSFLVGGPDAQTRRLKVLTFCRLQTVARCAALAHTMTMRPIAEAGPG